MADDAKKTLADKIIGASLIVGLAHLCLKFAGLIQSIFAAKYLTTAEYEPIIAVAFTGIIYSIFLIFEEVIGPTFLPLFMQEKEERGEKAAWNFANVVLTVQILILLVIVLLVCCFPDIIIRTFTDWSPEKGEAYGLLRKSLIILAPCILFLSIGSTTYMLLNGYKRFFLAAFGDASWKICVILALFVGLGIFKWDYRAVLFGFLAGSIAKLLTHLVGLGKLMTRFRLTLKADRPAVLKALLILMIPLILGILFAKFRDLYNNVYILTYIKGINGLLQANDLGRKLYTTLVWLVPFTLQIALFPFLCELVDRNDKEKLAEVITNSCFMLLAVFIPGALFLMIVSEPMSMVLFLRGKMVYEVAQWTGLSMACYILVLPAAAMEAVLMQGYFANRKTLSVTIIGACCSLVSVVVSYIFIVHMQWLDVRALMVVALGFVFSRLIKAIILAIVLRRSVPIFPPGKSSGFLFKLLVLAALVAAAAWGGVGLSESLTQSYVAESATELKELDQRILDLKAQDLKGDAGVKRDKTVEGLRLETGSRHRKVQLSACLKLALASIFAALVYFSISALMGIKEPRIIFSWGWQKVAGKFSKN